MRGFLGLLKISRDGLDISEGYAGSADDDAEPAAGAGLAAAGAELAAGGVEPAAGAELAAGGAKPADSVGSGEIVARGVGNAGAEAAERSFEVSGGRSGINGGRTSMVSLISSSSKSSRINPPNNIINSSGAFIIIIIFFKGFLSFFRLK